MTARIVLFGATGYTGARTGRVGEAPSQATLAEARTRTVAELRSGPGELGTRVQLSGPETYGFTAEMLAWGATRAAEAGLVRS